MAIASDSNPFLRTEIGLFNIYSAFDDALARWIPTEKAFTRLVPLIGQWITLATIRAVFVVRYVFVSPEGEQPYLLFHRVLTFSCGLEFGEVLKICLDAFSYLVGYRLISLQLYSPMKNLDSQASHSCKVDYFDHYCMSFGLRKLGHLSRCLLPV